VAVAQLMIASTALLPTILCLPHCACLTAMPTQALTGAQMDTFTVRGPDVGMLQSLTVSMLASGTSKQVRVLG
jgi:hypothetical protein